MEYLQKIEEANSEDLLWNIPEQKQGAINIIGGNTQNFRTPVKVAEFLITNYPIKTTYLVLPDALRDKLPMLENLVFLRSTESGSLADGEELFSVMETVDFNLLVGDLSKNTITGKAVQEACRKITKPTLMTRDAVDIVTEDSTERILMNPNLIFFGSMMQIQKIFRAVYYPKMLTLTQSLVQVAEALHKFTLSYPATLVTLHDGQILLVQNGVVNVVPLNKTPYSPLTLWSGELAAKMVALNLYNPNNFLKATIAALTI